jgi:hypothetical protein
MKKQKIRFGFNILTESGPLPKPIAVHVAEAQSDTQFSKPLKYMADALVGLSLIRVNPNLQCPLNSGGLPVEACHEAWHHLDPHHTLYKRSEDRVQALKAKVPFVDPKLVAGFEKSFIDTLNTACHSDGVDLKDLWPLLDTITYLEGKISSPLLFTAAKPSMDFSSICAH